MKTIALQLHEYEYRWVGKIRNTSRQYLSHNTPHGHHITDQGLYGLGEYNCIVAIILPPLVLHILLFHGK